MSYSSTYLFKRVDAWNLDPSPSLKVFADYDGWTNHPSRLTDSDGNQFSVTYDNNTDVFNYHPQLGFSSGLTRYVKDDSGNLDVFYQYKFFFDSGTTTYHIWESLPRWKLPRQDVLSEWQNYLKAEYEQQVLPRIQNVSSLVDQLSADNNPPQTSLSVSNIRTDLIAWIDLYYGKIHVRPQSVFQLTSSDNSSGVDITSYRIFNQTYESGWITLACSNNNPVTFAMPLGLGNGQYKIEYNSTDCVGNVEAPKQFVGVPQTGWLFNTTIQSPTYVFERADLDVSPKVLDAEVHAGSSLALNFTIYEVTGFDAVHNVSLHASILASVDNKTVSSDQWNFPVNYFAVSALGQTNVTVILDLPTNQSKGNYTGVIEATYDGKMQEVLVNITVLSRGDINNDGAVDIYDAIILAHAFNSHPGASEWNPSADINNDGVVDIYDAIILAGNFEH